MEVFSDSLSRTVGALMSLDITTLIQCIFYCHCVEKMISHVYVGPPPKKMWYTQCCFFIKENTIYTDLVPCFL